MMMGHRYDMVGEIWAFLRERKKWWLLPIIVLFLVIGLIMLTVQGSVLAPFIYTVF